MGESHYQWKEAPNINEWREITITLVREQMSGGSTKAFWTNIATAFLDRRPSLADKVDFWNSVAFYNYVQESAGDGARIAPEEGSWARSEDAFRQVMDHLRPQAIFALGYRLKNRLPVWSRKPGPVLDDAPQKESWIYSHQGGSCLIYAIRHPSSGFNGRSWHPHLMSALEKS